MQSHLHQNMCVEHPNRMLANGPNHPGPGPGSEEIPMVDVSNFKFLNVMQILLPKLLYVITYCKTFGFKGFTLPCKSAL